MIACLRGLLLQKSANAVVIDCHGVGYEVAVPVTVAQALPAIGDSVYLLTELIIRAESNTLFGFIEEREREVFRRLLKVSGIGSKTALAMLSAMTVDELLMALANEDVTSLSKIPGIGKKSADRLIVDFRGSTLLRSLAVGYKNDDYDDVKQALATLGYKRQEIEKALGAITYDQKESVAERVRKTLQWLSKAKK